MALELAAQGVRLALTDVDVDGGRDVCAEVRDKFKTDVVFARLDVAGACALKKAGSAQLSKSKPVRQRGG